METHMETHLEKLLLYFYFNFWMNICAGNTLAWFDWSNLSKVLFEKDPDNKMKSCFLTQYF